MMFEITFFFFLLFRNTYSIKIEIQNCSFLLDNIMHPTQMKKYSEFFPLIDDFPSSIDSNYLQYLIII